MPMFRKKWLGNFAEIRTKENDFLNEKDETKETLEKIDSPIRFNSIRSNLSHEVEHRIHNRSFGGIVDFVWCFG